MKKKNNDKKKIIYNKLIDAKDIINKLFWIDAKVNNEENQQYRNILKKEYNLNIMAYTSAVDGIDALNKIKFESVFIITSGTIYPEFYSYLKREYKELRLLPFSIIFTSSSKKFIEKHKNDEIGKLYNKTFFNKGGVVDRFSEVKAFINDIYTKLNNYQTINKYKGIYTKNYSDLIVFEKVKNNLPLPIFYKDIYKNKKINYSDIKNFTKFFLDNFCTEKIEKLLKPLILFEDLPETIISKYWARVYTYETPFYSIMNKNLMNRNYKEYQIYIQLLYKGLKCNSYKPKFIDKYSDELYRGTTLDKSEIKYLKDISGKGQIIINKSFLSFTLNTKKAIEFQDNEEREEISEREEIPEEEDTQAIVNEEEKPDKEPEEEKPKKKEPEKIKKETCITSEKKKNDILKDTIDSLDILIILENISEKEKNNYIMSNAYLNDISYYSKEEEVLIFPFTGFEVVNWEKTEFNKEDKTVYGTKFYFKFSNNYLKLVEQKYK